MILEDICKHIRYMDWVIFTDEDTPQLSIKDIVKNGAMPVDDNIAKMLSIYCNGDVELLPKYIHHYRIDEELLYVLQNTFELTPTNDELDVIEEMFNDIDNE